MYMGIAMPVVTCVVLQLRACRPLLIFIRSRQPYLTPAAGRRRRAPSALRGASQASWASRPAAPLQLPVQAQPEAGHRPGRRRHHHAQQPRQARQRAQGTGGSSKGHHVGPYPQPRCQAWGQLQLAICSRPAAAGLLPVQARAERGPGRRRHRHHQRREGMPFQLGTSPIYSRRTQADGASQDNPRQARRCRRTEANTQGKQNHTGFSLSVSC